MKGANLLALLVVSLVAVVVWRSWPQGEPPVEEPLVSGPPVIERGFRRPVTVLEPERVEDQWTRKNAEAIRRLEAGELEVAVALFSECVAGDPSERVFQANLAEALARLARREYEDPQTRSQAIVHLEQAVELAPERVDLFELLARWRAEVEVVGDFWTDRSMHFRLSYDGDREELLGRGYELVLRTLEDAYAEFAGLFGVRPAEGGEPAIEVVLLRREEFSELTGLGHWAGGAYDGRIRIPVSDLEKEERQLVRVLRHELAHAFVQAAGGRGVAGWLNEGLAEFLEEPAGATRSSGVSKARERAAKAELRPLAELGGTLASLGDVDEIRGAYAQSLAFVGWIEHWYGERVLFEMVGGCRVGASIQETFKARTRVSLEKVLEDLSQDLGR